MITNVNIIVFSMIGLILISLLSPSYGQVSLESKSISGGATNSTSPGGLKMLGTVGEIAGFLTSSGFQLFAGFLPTTQGGNAIPTSLFSGVTGTVASDGTVTVSLSETSSGALDFTELYSVATSGGEDSITTDRDFSFTDSGTFGGTVLIPSGTQITADTAAWDGSFTVPQDLGTTIGVPGGDTTLAIRVGSTTIDFTLNHPIRIVFTGKVGQDVSVLDKNGLIIPITTLCNGIDFATVDAQLGPDEVCKINNYPDLIVWTQRLSTFVSSIEKTGGFAKDFEGPSLSQSFGENESPLVIDSTAFPKLGTYTEKTQTVKVETGTPIPFRVLLNENSGPQNVQHVALYMNLHGVIGTEVHKSDTWLVFEKGNDIEIHDPRGFIAGASTSIATINDKFETSFHITFAKPMERSNLIIVAWDGDRNSMTSTVLDAFEVVDPNAEAKKQQKAAILAEAQDEVKEKETALAEAQDEVKEREQALVYAMSKYGTASKEAKFTQEALDKVKDEAKAAQDALDEANNKAEVAQETLDEAKDELSKEIESTSVKTQPQAVEPTSPTPEPGVDIVLEPGVDIMTSDQEETIQKWAGFHVASASDSDLFNALNIKTEPDSTYELPKWTRNTLAKWALDEKISMKEFINAVKYFVAK